MQRRVEHLSSEERRCWKRWLDIWCDTVTLKLWRHGNAFSCSFHNARLLGHILILPTSPLTLSPAKTKALSSLTSFINSLCWSKRISLFLPLSVPPLNFVVERIYEPMKCLGGERLNEKTIIDKYLENSQETGCCKIRRVVVLVFGALNAIVAGFPCNLIPS